MRKESNREARTQDKAGILCRRFLGEKTFEIRNNADRNFQVGDTLMLKAWDGEFTGDFVEEVVSYITDFEQKPGIWSWVW